MQNDAPETGVITEAYINLNELAERVDNYGLRDRYATGHTLRVRLIGDGLEVQMTSAAMQLDHGQAKSLADWLQHHIR